MQVVLLMMALVAGQPTIADGTAVDALTAFEGEDVLIETRDGRKTAGTLKKVTASAVVVVSSWDGVVVSLRPADVVGVRVRSQPAPASTPEPSPPPSPPSSPPVGVVEISSSLRAEARADGSILLYPAMRLDRDCGYRLDHEAAAVRLEFVAGPPAALLFPPRVPLEPNRRNRILGCDETFPLSTADIQRLMAIRQGDRVVVDTPRRFRDAAVRAAPASSKPTERRQASSILEDAEWDRNAALAIGLGGGAVGTVLVTGSTLLASRPESLQAAQTMILAAGVLGSVTTVAAVGFGVKSIFEYQAWERATR